MDSPSSLAWVRRVRMCLQIIFVVSAMLSQISDRLYSVSPSRGTKAATKSRGQKANAPERDGVAPDAERSPLLGDRLGKTDDTSLGGGVVGLADVAVQAGDGRDVDDRAVARGALRVLGAQVRGSFLFMA